VRHHLLQECQVLLDGCGEHDEVGVVQRAELGGPGVNSPASQPLAQHGFAVDGEDMNGGPGAAGRKCNRPADQPEADDSNLVKGGF
jgi:hypothetical protein